MGDFETIKENASLHDFAEQFLVRSRGGMWCCPACGSGTHGTHTSDGALSITRDGNHWQCFSCSAQGDIFDLAGIVWDIPDHDKRGRLEAVADWAGVQIGGVSNQGARARFHGRAEKSPRRAKPAEDFAEGRRKEAAYIEAMRANIDNPEAVSYLAARGFTIEDARAEGLGYDPERRRLVIPWRGADWYHVDRAIADNLGNKYLKPKSEQVGAQPLYNPRAVREKAFFIVEGVLDAIAVHLCGFEAVAVASSSISERNLTELAALIPSGVSVGVAVIMLDNDQAGRDGTEKVRAAFESAGIAYTIAEAFEGMPKDAAEWYRADKAALRAFLGERYNRAGEIAAEAKEQAYRAAMSRFRVLDPASVAADIFTLTDFEEPTPTGITALDDILDGGLRSGLYALGAVSSMGKTTLSVQVADYIAEHGRGVLFVTIEQSAREIASKSLSRLTRTVNAVGNNVVTSTEALSASRRERWGDQQAGAFLKACEHYAARIAPRLRILEGTKQPGVSDIEIVARMMAEHDGEPPAVFIDYLQLLAASSDHDTDKQAIDKNVMMLRQLARDMKTPIWVISSLNRSSYSEGVTMDSWKESGAIEYGCDVLLGLQPQGLRDKLEKVAEGRQRRTADNELRRHKAGYERACELVILKNRNGRTPDDGIPLTFKPLSSLYVEDEREQQVGRYIG